MNKLNKIAIAISLIGCSASASLHAQSADYYNPSWYVAPSINAFHPDKRFGVDKNGEGAGLRFGKPISQSWDVQMGTSFARSSNDGVRYTQVLLGADALYMFSRERLRPFLMIGAGAERDKVKGGAGDVAKTSPYINAGIGVQYSLNDQWSTQIDFRRVHGYLRNNTFGFDRSNNNYLTIGLNYAFDKPAAPAATPAPVAAVEPVAVAPAPMPTPKPAPRFEKYTLSATELFAFGSDDLRMPQPKLDEIATALNNNQDVSNVDITGYADRLGSEKFNMKLSERRAVTVKNYLVAQGVNANRLNAMGKGEANPVVVCTEKKRAALIECLEPNRRVEVEQITIERRVK
jgi:OOP family OmpA-OmpF porin